MLQYTSQLKRNISNMKNVPGIVDVRVFEAEDFITQQTNVKCLKFLFIGTHGRMEIYVPEELCMHHVFDITNEMIERWTAPINEGYVKEYKFESMPRRFIDLETQNFNRLDGAIPITNPTEEQQNLIEMLNSINEIDRVVIQKIVDPQLKILANCANPVLVTCHPVGTNSNRIYEFIVPEMVYINVENHETSLQTLRNLISEAQ